MKISFILLLASLRFQLAMMQNFNIPREEFWAALMRDANFAQDYDTNYSHDADADQAAQKVHANATTQKLRNNQQQPQHSTGYKIVQRAPNNSREEIYVFLDEGRTSNYSSMNVQGVPKKMYNDNKVQNRQVYGKESKNIYNTRWRNIRRQGSVRKYGHEFARNSRNQRNIRKRRNCFRKRVSNLRPLPRLYDSYDDYDYVDEIRANSCRNHIGPYRNKFKKVYRNSFNEPCNRRRKLICSSGRQQLHCNCTTIQPKAEIIVKNVTTVKQQTVQHVESQAETEVLIGNSKAKTSSQSATKLNNENDFIVGSTITSDKEKRLENAQNKFTAIQKIPTRSDDKPLTESPIHHVKAKGPNQLNKSRRRPIIQNTNPVLDFNDRTGSFTQTAITEKSPQLQENMTQKHTTLPPMRESNQVAAEENKLNTNSTIEQPVPSTTPNVEVNAEIKTTTVDISKASDADFDKTTENTAITQTKDIDIETKIETETDTGSESESESETKTMVDGFDLSPSEDRLYTYVTKLDGTALDLDNKIKYMEPIAYETLISAPEISTKHLEEKSSKSIASKPKRNVQTRALDFNKGLKPRQKKFRATNTTMTSTTTTPASPTWTTGELDEPRLQLRFQSDEQFVNNNLASINNNNNANINNNNNANINNNNNANFNNNNNANFNNNNNANTKNYHNKNINDKNMDISNENVNSSSIFDNNNNNSSNISSNSPFLMPTQRFNKANEVQLDMQKDLQVLGSTSSFAEDYEEYDNPDLDADPCENIDPLDYSNNDVEDYFDQQPPGRTGFMALPEDAGIELYSADLKNSPNDCNEASDAVYEGDQHIQMIVGTVTPSPRRKPDDDCIT